MRMKGIPIGVDDFKKIIEGNGYFVDKSLFIKEVIDDLAKPGEEHSIANFDDKRDGTSLEVKGSYNRVGLLGGSHTKFVPWLDNKSWGGGVALAHELKHGYNRKHGKQDGSFVEPNNPDPRSQFTTFEEVDAVNFQNILHWHQGLPLRTTYGIIDILKYLIPAVQYDLDPLKNNYHKK